MTLQSNFPIPFNRADLLGSELENIKAAVTSGQIAGDHGFTRKCEALLQEQLRVHRCLLTTSCTHALEMSALLLELKPGDEVIIPSFTFVSTATAFALRGATPIFADIRPDTLNIDEGQIESLITPRTKAIVPVHYAGVSCEMDTLISIAERHNLTVVEDNAHGLFGRYKGQALGTFGALATQSFHATKNFSCGEGGALLINDPKFAERAEILREKGTDRSKFFRGEVDKYSWVDIGSSYVPSDLLAAYLLAQLELRDRIQTARRKIWDNYQQGLARWAAEQDIRLPHVPTDCEPAWHLFYLLLPDPETREALRLHLRSKGILAVSHYVPLHSSRYGSRWGASPHSCPVTDRTAETLLRLPFYNSMTYAEQNEVIGAVTSFHTS
ncbi:MAG: dTDP-4-amino-4,6-dideoxygalactose transaminase [Synoicihabitans sp.]